MKENLTWQYNEFNQVGKDYSKQEEVAEYEARHSDFRDIEGESNNVLDSLGVGKNDILIDFGSGTGIFALQAASRCKMVYAVDVSKAMRNYAKTKAEKAGVSNINFSLGGFLNFEIEEETVDFITTTFVLHHIPDFWKGVALKRLFKMLKPGGRLYIHDVVIQKEKAIENIQALIEKLAEAGGNFMREDAEGHFREEFSTYDWIMDGLLSRSGFEINNKDVQDGVVITYHCTRQS